MARLTIADHTEVVIGDELPDEILPPRPGRSRVAVLTQPAVTDLAVEVADRVRGTGLAAEVIGLPDRDEAKTLAVAASVYETLARFGLSRQDTIVSVGGGATSDLAGFVAGTWLRGVEAVHVPTTLLGAIDASIGGKTGVNVGGKNLVGVFWHPSRVIIDIATLSRLPIYLTREGMAEAYKAGLIGDAGLVAMIRRHGLRAPLGDVVDRAVRVKAGIVGEDDREHGVRAYLNFGHTIGHAIEYASALSHGESVGLGMVAAAHISRDLVGFTGVDDVTRTVEKLGLPTMMSGLDPVRVMDLIEMDKKRDSGGLRMVLLADVAQPRIVHVREGDVRRGLASIGI